MRKKVVVEDSSWNSRSPWLWKREVPPQARSRPDAPGRTDLLCWGSKCCSWLSCCPFASIPCIEAETFRREQQELLQRAQGAGSVRRAGKQRALRRLQRRALQRAPATLPLGTRISARRNHTCRLHHFPLWVHIEIRVHLWSYYTF